MKHKILIIEDEEHIGAGLKFNFLQEGYEVNWVTSAEEANEKMEALSPHLIVLDIMLPGMNGYEFLQNLRKNSKNVPVLILSAKDQVEDKIQGLKLGCDDYLAKPFALEELLLRIARMLERLNMNFSEEFSFGPYQVQESSLSATREGVVHALTPQEFKILQVLYKNKGKIVPRELLLKEALGYSQNVESRTIDNFVVRLRKALEKNPKKPQLIQSVRGAGYIYP